MNLFPSNSAQSVRAFINMLLTFLVGALTLLLAWDFVRKRHSYATLSKSGIKGPLSLPLVGCGFQALQLGADSEF